MSHVIRIRNARQNNLKNLDLSIPLYSFVVITGVSGSGKSSLAFDTLFAEGQRRYVETFSPYARQFLDRMDRPHVDRIEGIPPAVAIAPANPVRTSRSTVGTLTEINDYLKLLFARVAFPICPGCSRRIVRDTPETVYASLKGDRDAFPAPWADIRFHVHPSDSQSLSKRISDLRRLGYRRMQALDDDRIEVVQDRLRFESAPKSRWIDDLEAAFAQGSGPIQVVPVDADGTACGEPRRYSAALHCPDCNQMFRDPIPSLFSFNSPVGACVRCRGFGRVIDIDPEKVIPDDSLSIRNGAIRPWCSAGYRECHQDLMRFARLRGIPRDRAWRMLSDEQRHWVWNGEGDWESGVWYGVRRFFDWLETRAYRMHVRVLLARYRMYRECPDCKGSRLRPEALLWHIESEGVCASIGEVLCMPLVDALAVMQRMLSGARDEAERRILNEIASRMGFLCDVGLGYLTLGRQSRTLSGGELQRINLTTALGSALVNTLFVLDEPSIGLHPRDIGQLIRILHRLRDAGNSLVVVEHDPDMIMAADHVVELGPGPGEAGGRILFNGPVSKLLVNRDSRTASGLNRRYTIASDRDAHALGSCLRIHGAAANNLKTIDVALPVDRLVAITGVSGSGKSSLVEHVVYRGFCRTMGLPIDAPVQCDAIEGWDTAGELVWVDSSPLVKSTRSIPVGVVGALDPIRRRFAALPLARERGYTPGWFGFNSGEGRCPTCAGSGFEHVEMQFLSDVYLRCPDCEGCRFRPELLEVRMPFPDGIERSIADVLDLCAETAGALFRDDPIIFHALERLCDVGLGYLRLGQPVATLSGGESQRLKLAAKLVASMGARSKSKFSVADSPSKRMLLLLDEPTTGLHMQDVECLLGLFRRLIDDGHGIVVIEHNLTVIAAADWVIDLGPEGGEDGGRIVAEGTPEALISNSKGHTAQALRRWCKPDAPAPSSMPPLPSRRTKARREQVIAVHGAREHNLHDLSVSIPRDCFTVITGVSGSGKSTLAFDIVFAEGQRRYLECLNAYARMFVQPAGRPDVDAVTGLPPAVAIEQRVSRGGYKSTVATVTEIDPALRLLFVKLGVQYCPTCQLAVEPLSLNQIVNRLYRTKNTRTIEILAPWIVGRKGLYRSLADQAARRGILALDVDGQCIGTDAWPVLDRYQEHDIAVPVATLLVKKTAEPQLRSALKHGLTLSEGRLWIRDRLDPESPTEVYSTQRACPKCARGFDDIDPRLFSFHSRRGWCASCHGTGMAGLDETVEEGTTTEPTGICPECRGRRLNAEALSVRIDGRSLADMASMSIAQARSWFRQWRPQGRLKSIADEIRDAIVLRLDFLDNVGLSYLQLDRSVPTLSGGEAQRLRLSAQLGSNLRGVCYVLDEPTIGLHASDNDRLLEALHDLRRRGNTIVVVEHDEDTIRRADHVIDLGPGAGVHGGHLVAQGTPAAIARNKDSLTGRCLRSPRLHPARRHRRPVQARQPAQSRLTIEGASLHNLCIPRLSIPLQRLVAVTGVSGSGKSTLVHDVIFSNVQWRIREKSKSRFRGCRSLQGSENLRSVLEVDAAPIGRTPRSCPATYIGIWDHVRRLFAACPEARMRGFSAGRFSFNTAEGRCPACEGQGRVRVEMSFLPDVSLVCETCGGRRFTPETLAVRYAGRSVAEILAMTAEEAAHTFAAVAVIHRPLSLMCDVGLGYLQLGQPSPTLSGGEAQRLKLVSELSRAVMTNATAPGTPTLYVLDEPTIGLHMADVEKLVDVLHRLVDAGHSVIVIEHNLDLIAEADWVIDLGPGSGENGGRCVAQGSPESIAAKSCPTGKALRHVLIRKVP